MPQQQTIILEADLVDLCNKNWIYKDDTYSSVLRRLTLGSKLEQAVHQQHYSQ